MKAEIKTEAYSSVKINAVKHQSNITQLEEHWESADLCQGESVVIQGYTLS